MADICAVVLDGDRLVIGGGDGLQMWAWRDGTPLPLAAGRGLRVWDIAPATARDGTRGYLAGGFRDGAVMLWRDTSRTVLYHTASGARVTDVAVAADGRTAAAVTSQGKLVVIDVAAERVIAQPQADTKAWSRNVVFDAATSTIVTAGDDGRLQTWSLAGVRLRELRISSGKLFGLDVRAGRAVTASSDGGVALIDLATEQVRRFRGHDTAALTARFSPDGRWFVTGEESGRACLWSVDDDECHTWLDGHTKGVVTVTFASDDGTIFTGSKDGTVRSWRPTYDQPVEALLAELARYGSPR
jgi:WD40 repeat protein